MIQYVVIAAGLIAQGGQPKTTPEPQNTRLITYSEPEEWQATMWLSVSNGIIPRGVATRSQSTSQNQKSDQIWWFDGFDLMVPFVRRTSASVAQDRDPDRSLYRDRFSRTNEDEKTYNCNSSTGTVGPMDSTYVMWHTRKANGASKFTSVMEQNFWCYETEFDEELAGQLGWPDSWPAAAANTLQPERYVSLDAEGKQFENSSAVADLLKKWTNGQSPASIPPLQLAKWLAGSVQEFVRVNRPGMTERRDLARLGMNVASHRELDVRTAEQIAMDPRGTSHDMTVLLTAIYREAGIPARMVFGFQEKEKNGRKSLSKKEQIRSWVEFAMFDPDRDELTWVPVDVARMREKSSRMRPLDQKWEYFGNHDELDNVVPIAFHLVPPAEHVPHDSPGFIAFEMEPAMPEHVLVHAEFNIRRKPKTVGPD